MTPQQLLAELQKRNELLDWMLRLVPSNGGGSDLASLPSELEDQLRVAGIVDGTPVDRVVSHMRQNDWVQSSFETLLSQSPTLRQACSGADAGIVSGMVNDSEFNGHVYSCKSAQGLGYVIALPMGAMPLISFASEMVTLLVDVALCQVLGGAFSKAFGNRQEVWSLRIRRRLVRLFSRRHLSKRFSARINWEFGMMIRRYVDLGTVDPPDVIRELGAIPLVTDVRRWGHPLEAGSNLRHFAIRFLLLHECGHVAAGHGSIEMSTDPNHFETEFVADDFAFRELLGSAIDDDVATASALGAWLVLTVAAWIEDLSDKAAPRSHPPARARLDRLRAYLRSREKELPSMTRALEVLRTMTELEERLFEAAKSNGIFTDESTTLSRFLRLCVETSRHEMFYDQLPRWLLFGAPLRLCREIAELRVRMERRIDKDGQDASARGQLTLLMWAFEAAMSAPSNFFFNRLRAYYDQALAAPEDGPIVSSRGPSLAAL